MKYLGIINGWKETPAEYTKHLAECGTEEEVTICYMEPSEWRWLAKKTTPRNP